MRNPRKSPRKGSHAYLEFTKRKLAFKTTNPDDIKLQPTKDDHAPTNNTSHTLGTTSEKYIRASTRGMKPSTREAEGKYSNVQEKDRKHFHRKHFYLDDLPKTTEAAIKRRINHLGGVVEEFFSKEIYMVVTSKMTSTNQRGNRFQTSSTICAESPTHQQIESSKQKNIVPSTRANHILTMVKKEQSVYGMKIPIVEKAMNLNIRVITTNDFIKKYMKNISINSLDITETTKTQLSSKKMMCISEVKVEKLKKPFLKTEDQSKAFRPIYFHNKQWPILCLGTAKNQSPFDEPEKLMRRKDKLQDAEVDKETLSMEEQIRSFTQESCSVVRQSKEKRKKKKKPGYCDCCCVKYDCLQQHLKSEQHRCFSKDSSNFVELDIVLRGCSSYQKFVGSLNKIANNYDDDELETAKETARSPDNRLVAQVSTPTKRDTSNDDKVYQNSYALCFNEQDNLNVKNEEKRHNVFPLNNSEKNDDTTHNDIFCSDKHTPRKSLSPISKPVYSVTKPLPFSPVTNPSIVKPVNVKRKRRRKPSFLRSTQTSQDQGVDVSPHDENHDLGFDDIITDEGDTKDECTKQNIESVERVERTGQIEHHDSKFPHIQVDEEVSFNAATLDDSFYENQENLEFIEKVPLDVFSTVISPPALYSVIKNRRLMRNNNLFTEDTKKNLNDETLLLNLMDDDNSDEQKECFLGFKNNIPMMCEPGSCDSEKHNSSKLSEGTEKRVRNNSVVDDDRVEKRLFSDDNSDGDGDSNDAHNAINDFVCSPLNIDHIAHTDRTLREIVRRSTPTHSRKAKRCSSHQSGISVKLFSPSETKLSNVVEISSSVRKPSRSSKRKVLSPDIHILPAERKRSRTLTTSKSFLKNENDDVFHPNHQTECNRYVKSPDQFVTCLYDRLKSRRSSRASTESVEPGNEAPLENGLTKCKSKANERDEQSTRFKRSSRKASALAVEKIQQIGCISPESSNVKLRKSFARQSAKTATEKINNILKEAPETYSWKSNQEVSSKRFAKSFTSSETTPEKSKANKSQNMTSRNSSRSWTPYLTPKMRKNVIYQAGEDSFEFRSSPLHK